METSIALNDDLLDEAFKYAQAISSKKELIETALKEYMENRKRKSIKELKGKIKFRDDYDYRSMRN